MTVEPFVTAASDYHEFDNVLNHFHNAGIDLEFEEVGCGYSDYWRGPHGGYHAVFWSVGQEKPELLIKEWTNYFWEQ